MVFEEESFFTVNPDTLNDENLWSYRDLQLICMRLKLSGKGKRGELVDRLNEWHRWRDTTTKENEEMNVAGNNFAILPVNPGVVSSECKKSKSRVTESKILTSPVNMRPLLQDGTPSKKILKLSESTCPDSVGKLTRITFSPFNGVKVIPNRCMEPPPYRFSFPEDDQNHLADCFDEMEIDIYSDDETSDLVQNNTILNSKFI